MRLEHLALDGRVVADRPQFLHHHGVFSDSSHVMGLHQTAGGDDVVARLVIEDDVQLEATICVGE